MKGATMVSERTARTRLEYWRECLEEMGAELHGIRRRYAEARERDEGQEELASIAESGERMAARVQDGERMILEEEARLAAEKED